MYWVDSGSSPRIERATMSGQSRHQLITTDIREPAGLTIDFTEQKLYWSDVSLHKVRLPCECVCVRMCMPLPSVCRARPPSTYD
jgi:hypothetical protein